jgi:hypothetical protein
LTASKTNPAAVEQDSVCHKETAGYLTRDYKKLFGEPPARDAERLREGAKGSTTS